MRQFTVDLPSDNLSIFIKTSIHFNISDVEIISLSAKKRIQSSTIMYRLYGIVYAGRTISTFDMVVSVIIS